MQKNKRDRLYSDLKIFVGIILCILINYFGKQMAAILELPLWLDSVGTAFSAYLFGPICGAIVGVTANIMHGLGEHMSYIYSLVSFAIGLQIGICAKKNIADSAFKIASVATLTTIIATVISAPLNLWFYDGLMGNKWGDAIFVLLQHMGFSKTVSSVAGEFFIDFADKALTLFLLFAVIHMYRFFKKKKHKYIEKKQFVASALLLMMVAASMRGNIQTFAAEEEEKLGYESYIQTVYNNSNGLSCGSANDIVTTNDGVLWIATYAGLYRYGGSEFQYMNNYTSVKNVNDLYVDEEGRLWIGTNDKGVSIYSRGDIVNILDTSGGLPSNSVRSIVRNSDGDYLVGTSDSLAIVSLTGGIHTKGVVDEVHYATMLASDVNRHTVAVTSSGQLFLMTGDEVTDKIANEDEYFTSCRYNLDGTLCVTTDTGLVYFLDTTEDKFTLKSIRTIPDMDRLNNTYEMEDGTIFVCADTGICYFDKNYKIHKMTTGNFNSSIDQVAVDYQGNIWFSSSRQGLMKMCDSAFAEMYPIAGLDERVVNTVTIWNNRLYCGTDNGLNIIDKRTHQAIENDALIEELAGARIRCMMVDSKNRLWICAYIDHVLCVDPDGTVTYIGAEEGVLGSRFRQALELADGTTLIASDKGITYIKDDEVIATIGEGQGLTNPVVLCMYERADGSILLGTDGGGIDVINDKKFTGNVTYDKFGSGVILRIVGDRDGDGEFVVTSNGLCYMTNDNEVKQLTNFPYSNNYDIYDNGEGKLFVTGSAGIYVVDKDELLEGRSLNYVQLNYINGLRQSLTVNAWNYVENDSVFYIADGSGVTRLDLDKYQSGAKSFRLILNTVKIDNVIHSVDRSMDIVMSGENTVLELTPELINYTAEEPTIRYYMEGYDNVPYDVKQNDLGVVSYKGLPSGNYKFHLAVLDNDNKVVEEQIYRIIRQQEFYESRVLIVYFIIELFVIIAWFAWFITRISMRKMLENKAREVERALEQVRLGNETIMTIAKTVDAKDENTSQHSIRVSEYSVLISKKLGYDDAQCEDLRKAALLHDIGKIGIPDKVLNKEEALDEKEYEIMKSHVTRGGDILKNFTFIPHVQEGALYHHERYDGKGYVHGLKGEEIPEFARIIGVADAFDAMTANRVYRPRMPFDIVLAEIKKGRGTQFDPRMVDILLEIIENGEIDIEALYADEEKEVSHE